jgi:dimethylhistidine N-methyltransferase
MTPPPPPYSSATLSPRPVRAPLETFRADALHGLRRPRKRLPCKYFYDQRGSELFDRICELPEYYLTRAETEILRQHARGIAEVIGPRAALVEYGSGSSTKTRILLDALARPHAYVPIDISRTHLMSASKRLASQYPSLRVLPVCADYTSTFALPASAVDDSARRVVFFPGSTIGNFEPRRARAFLRHIRNICGPEGAMLIGVDLKKDPAILHAAYNDSAGVTAQFNLNILVRINRELGGDFDLEQFAHYAFYNPRRGRIEMHLASRRAQVARVAGEAVGFAVGETIFTESSYKYARGEFADLAADAGFALSHCWTDAERLFAVMYLLPE